MVPTEEGYRLRTYKEIMIKWITWYQQSKIEGSIAIATRSERLRIGQINKYLYWQRLLLNKLKNILRMLQSVTMIVLTRSVIGDL